MVQTFSKPQAAREIEARARARRLGIEVRVVTEAQEYTSKSRSRRNVTYRQRRTPAGWVCTCQGYASTGCCKHIGQVERRAEREGWDFGAIAPLHRADKYIDTLGDLPVAPPTDTVIPFRRRERDAEEDEEPVVERLGA